VAREALIIDEDVATGGAFTPLPKAWYHVEIEDVEETTSKSAKNLGKDMYKYKFKVIGGDLDGRKVFTQACLWKEAIFTQRDIQAAIGYASLGEPNAKGQRPFNIADTDELIGKELKIYVIVKDKFVKEGEEPEENPDGSLVQDNEVKKFAPLSANSTASPAVKKAGGAKKAGQFDL
jgi:hypothetical protein